MSIFQANEALTFRFNTTNRDTIYGHFQNNSKVTSVERKDYGGIFLHIFLTVENYPDYEIRLYPDLLVIKYNYPIDTWIAISYVISVERSNISQVFIENFLEGAWRVRRYTTSSPA